MNLVRCTVLGTDHNLQRSDAGLRHKITSIISSNRAISLIAEECSDPNQITVAREIVQESNGLISWCCVDMTDEDRKKAGIYERLCIRPKLKFHPETGLDEDPRIYFRHADGVREEFWLDRIADAQPRDEVLIVCGWMHLEFLADKATKRGWSVSKGFYIPAGPEAYAFEIWD